MSTPHLESTNAASATADSAPTTAVRPAVVAFSVAPAGATGDKQKARWLVRPLAAVGASVAVDLDVGTGRVLAVSNPGSAP